MSNNTLDTLNKIVHKYLGDVDNILDVVPPLVMLSSAGNITIAPIERVAFNVHPMSTGILLPIEHTSELTNSLLVRQSIGYSLASRVTIADNLVNEMILIKTVLYMTQLAVNEMHKYTNMSNNPLLSNYRKVSIRLPSAQPSPQYFRDSSDTSGFEFRVWSSLEVRK